MSDDKIREISLNGLESMYPDFCRDDVLAFRVSRARCVMYSTTELLHNDPANQEFDSRRLCTQFCADCEWYFERERDVEAG